eukprot:Partr_v1_DN27777_c0_g1_i2_m67387 putative NatA auxiliary subunit
MTSAVAAALAAKNQLPNKEAGLLKTILRQYEHKQYKKGLKAADQILKKFPEHGETLAMKGLFLSHLDNKHEAYECVKKGLRYHLTSPICWHVYGLLYRMDKNYEEAMKCYRHALKYDKDNVQVLRDFSYLQIQMRDYEGFNDTKSRLLNLRPNQRAFWIGLAISYHLLRNYEHAIRVIDAFLDTEKDRVDNSFDFDRSELLLFKNDILFQSGDLTRALDDLTVIQGQVCDPNAWLVRKGEILLKLERFGDARDVYARLMDRNCEMKPYAENLVYASRRADASLSEYDIVSQLLVKYPRSHTLQKYQLVAAPVEKFGSVFGVYVKEMLRKGAPSLFVNIRILLEDEQKRNLIVEMCEAYRKNLEATGKFAEGEPSEPPTCFVWTLYLVAQIYLDACDSLRAIATVDEALAHSPTLLELYMLKARILKNAGDLQTAAFYMNEARSLDMQDRFINSKCAKYMLRVDNVAEAEQTIALFARQGDMEEKMADLVEMQCMWFTNESAQSYLRSGNLALALKKFHQISKHFADITDDQFDFHTYCLRKMTIRSYNNLLRLEDNLYENKNYIKAAVGAISCYLRLHDDPKAAKSIPLNGLDAELSESEKRKLLSKQKKAALANEENKAAGSKSEKKVKDDD